jgi:UDP-4-amino-4,6-dideoxy-N-acetyl-beta-L-altrosamine N-acetyltransferase
MTGSVSQIARRPYVLKNICNCTREQQLGVLDVRNQDSIRRSMYTEHKIGIDEHLNWISRLSTDEKQRVFAVLREERPVGIVSVNAIDALHRKTDWAFYLLESERGGLGATLEVTMINYVFQVLGFDKLNCEVLETNPNVVKMHLKFGFEQEGFRRSNVIKDGRRIGVHFLGLTREDWMSKREAIESPLAPILAKFDIRFADDASAR